jgi:glucan phosphoethanolaminetransferase (alkaline phosphatase superfamily)
VLVAFVLLVLLAPFTFYVEVVVHRYYEFPVGAVPVAVLFLATATMSIPGLKRLGLTRRELLVVYCVVVVGGWLYKYSVLFYMIPTESRVYGYVHGCPENPSERSSLRDSAISRPTYCAKLNNVGHSPAVCLADVRPSLDLRGPRNRR